MAKSVYSLVLEDGVVRAVDQMAYLAGTSRSNLINQILAESCSYVTPEKRMKDVFSVMEQWVSAQEGLQMAGPATLAVMSIRSALAYKYRPTIRYAVELYPQDERYLGELRVTLRTQNQGLMDEMDHFLTLWVQIEETYSAGRAIREDWSGGGGRYRRRLAAAAAGLSDSEEAARAIFDYIEAFDQGLKTYFDGSGEVSTPGRMEAGYRTYRMGGAAPV